MTTTELEAVALGQADTYIQNVVGLNMLAVFQPVTNLGQWCSSTTYERTIKNQLKKAKVIR